MRGHAVRLSGMAEAVPIGLLHLSCFVRVQEKVAACGAFDRSRRRAPARDNTNQSQTARLVFTKVGRIFDKTVGMSRNRVDSSSCSELSLPSLSGDSRRV